MAEERIQIKEDTALVATVTRKVWTDEAGGGYKDQEYMRLTIQKPADPDFALAVLDALIGQVKTHITIEWTE